MNQPEPRPSGTSGKIRRPHLERLAVVYVRQSTQRQVIENRESTDLQYKLTHKAEELGWRPDRVLVIDDDLGHSGSSAADRAGFPEAPRRGGAEPRGPDPGIGDEPVGPLLQGLVSAARAGCRLRRAHRRPGRPLRPGRVQRPATARPQGNDERGGAPRPPGPPAPGQAQQGGTG